MVGAPSYAEFCDVGGLRERIDRAPRRVDVDDTEALDAATAEVREMVEAEPFPDVVAQAIRDRVRRVARRREDDTPVAVRSSATAEDTEAAPSPA